MKSLFFSVAFLGLTILQPCFAQDTTRQTQLSPLLRSYYDIKNALITGNTTSAAEGAEQFVKTANGISHTDLSEGNRDALLKDAGEISEDNNIIHQRELFANLSVNMIALAKSFKLSSQPVYKIYCPMKKTYWLSSEPIIKNPYYGSAMLTCGSVKETL